MFMYCICTPGVNSCCVYSYVLGQRWRAHVLYMYMQYVGLYNPQHVHVHCTCTCSGGRALMAKVRGPRFNPGWLPVFLSPLKIFLSISIMYMYSQLQYGHRAQLLTARMAGELLTFHTCSSAAV